MKMTFKTHYKRFKALSHSKQGVVTITKLLIGLALFSLFAVVLLGAYYDMTSAYNVPVSQKSTDSYNKITAISNKTTAIGEQFQGGKLEDTNTLIIAAKSVWASGQLIFSGLTIPLEIIKQITSDLPLPIPTIFISTLIAILSIVVIYLIASLFARWPS